MLAGCLPRAAICCCGGAREYEFEISYHARRCAGERQVRGAAAVVAVTEGLRVRHHIERAHTPLLRATAKRSARRRRRATGRFAPLLHATRRCCVYRRTYRWWQRRPLPEYGRRRAECRCRYLVYYAAMLPLLTYYNRCLRQAPL